MQADLVFIKIKQRINKGDSADYDNIECWQAREAFNKAQLEWIRRQVHGKNDTQEGDEQSTLRIDDLQQLLTPAPGLTVRQNGVFFELKELPTNFLYIKRVTPIISKGKCKNKKIESKLREEVNVDELLQDYSTSPSFEFEQTFHTMINNTIRVYAKEEFYVNKIDLIYYRKPVDINFGTCINLDGTSGPNQDPELKDDVVELIIDDAVAILAGDIESPNALTIGKQRSENNN